MNRREVLIGGALAVAGVTLGVSTVDATEACLDAIHAEVLDNSAPARSHVYLVSETGVWTRHRSVQEALSACYGGDLWIDEAS